MMIVVTLALLIIFKSTKACPPQQDLKPCTCYLPDTERSAFITCSKLDNIQDLTSSAKSLVGKRYIHSFSIEDSVFNFIPVDTFKGLMFAELDIKDSSLMALTDSDLAFEGLEDYLKILRIENCSLLNEWEWSIFRNLKKLKLLEIEKGALEGIEDLGKLNLANLEVVSFSHNLIDYIQDNAFSNCAKLTVLSLSNNMISDLKRSMFPNPASELLDIDLSNNEIEELPADIFNNMPSLTNLSVGKNKILLLDEKVFLHVWSNLEMFEAMGNEIRCDCRIIWILNKNKPKVIRATCANPQSLKGRSVASLASKDLWCLL